MGDKFDFRDMQGGANARVENDPALADGANADGAIGLCAHLLAKRPGIPQAVEFLARSVIGTANLNGVCAGALLALTVERVGAIAQEEAETGDLQRLHVMAEVAMRLGCDIEFDRRG